MEGKVNFKLIVDQAEEFEIAKVTYLLLVAGIECHNNHAFVESASKLEQNAQMEIKGLIEALVMRGGQGKPLDSNFSAILMQKLGQYSLLCMSKFIFRFLTLLQQAMPGTPLLANPILFTLSTTQLVSAN